MAEAAWVQAAGVAAAGAPTAGSADGGPPSPVGLRNARGAAIPSPPVPSVPGGVVAPAVARGARIKVVNARMATAATVTVATAVAGAIPDTASATPRLKVAPRHKGAPETFQGAAAPMRRQPLILPQTVLARR